MEHHTETGHRHAKSATTPKDFFLWFTAIGALYGSVTAFFTLIFDYINIAFPDPLAYAGDPFAASTRVAMATLIVLIPIMLGALLTIRRDIVRTPGKADIWVRRWALVLTIFIAAATAAIDLITLINSFLGGEITTRFALKALIVLLIATLVGLHFWADLKGYWTLHRQKANIVGAGIGALAVMTVISGFLIIGSPSHIRALRLDQQRVSDLQTLQYSITNYYQQKRALPSALEALTDPLTGTIVPLDPVTGQPYEYSMTSPLTFNLCANFSANSTDTAGQGAYRDSYGGSYSTGYSEPGYMGQESFVHGMGRTCFSRTVDPDKYPPFTDSPKAI